jgi:hypothetical protein
MPIAESVAFFSSRQKQLTEAQNMIVCHGNDPGIRHPAADCVSIFSYGQGRFVP